MGSNLVKCAPLKRAAFLTAMLLSAPLAHSDSPYSISVAELINRADETGDNGALARASARCSALFMVTSGVIQRDSPSSDVTEYESGLENLYIGANLIDSSVAQSRGSTRSAAEIADSVTQEVTAHSEKYRKWFESNYIEQGEYFGSSPELVGELGLCRQLAAKWKSAFSSN